MNKNLALVAVFSVILAANVEAQSNLVLRDGDGDGIGTLLGFDNAFSVRANFYTADGNLIFVDTLTGRVWPEQSVYFATADCSGQAYLQVSNFAGENWAKRGGAIFRAQTSPGKFAKIDWAPQVLLSSNIFSEGQCWRFIECGEAPLNCNFEADYVPVSIIDNSQYGIKPLQDGSGYSGFLPPITGQVQTTGDLIFCDGFECKQQ
jgi:hypothetical protein